MYPLAHFLVALLPTAGYVSLREGRLPTGRFVALVFVGSQFPDLIDKPLAHQFGLIPSGRVFMHSLPFAVPFLLLVGYYGWRTGRLRASGAFAVAYLLHLLGDTYHTLLEPTPALSPDLLWPFVDPIPRETIPYWAGPAGANVRLWTMFSVVVLALVTIAMVRDLDTYIGSGS